MRSPQPPALAIWLLERFSRNDPLTGDLIEEYRGGRSPLWFWRQTMAAVLVRRGTAVASTAGLVALYLVGRHIAIPGVNAEALNALARDTGGSFRVYDILSGGNLAPVSILALAIHPYTTAVTAVESILWLRRRAVGAMTGPSPRLIVLATWLLAILLATTQALGLALFLERQSQVAGGLTLVAHPGWTFRIPAIMTLTGATACLMWISDRLSTRSIANGLIVVFLAGLLAGLPAARAVSVAGVFQLAATVTIVSIMSRAYRRDLCASVL